MSFDHPDIAHASKEVSKSMSAPSSADWIPVKRLARYVTKYQICVTEYVWQGEVQRIPAYTDSDWGGDLESRRSTSGGCLMRGSHVLSHWSRTQQVVSLSLAEAELTGMCKAAAEELGAKNMASELAQPVGLEILTDASAARGVIQLQGAGRIKHVTKNSCGCRSRSPESNSRWRTFCVRLTTRTS